MARLLNGSSFECDCGHQSHFCYNTIWEMEAASRRGRKQHLLDSERDEHTIEFSKGEAMAIICPKLGRLEIRADLLPARRRIRPRKPGGYAKNRC